MQSAPRWRGLNQFVEPLVPVVFVATGRSGSTLLMELLGTSPDVLFERVYAYERAYLTYLLQWARLPLEGAASSDRWHRASIDQVGHVPAGKLLGGIPWTERRLLGGRRATVVGTSPPGRLAYRLGSDENDGRHRPTSPVLRGDGPDLGSQDGAARPADPGRDIWCAIPATRWCRSPRLSLAAIPASAIGATTRR